MSKSTLLIVSVFLVVLLSSELVSSHLGRLINKLDNAVHGSSRSPYADGREGRSLMSSFKSKLSSSLNGRNNYGYDHNSYALNNNGGYETRTSQHWNGQNLNNLGYNQVPAGGIYNQFSETRSFNTDSNGRPINNLANYASETVNQYEVDPLYGRHNQDLSRIDNLAVNSHGDSLYQGDHYNGHNKVGKIGKAIGKAVTSAVAVATNGGEASSLAKGHGSKANAVVDGKLNGRDRDHDGIPDSLEDSLHNAKRELKRLTQGSVHDGYGIHNRRNDFESQIGINHLNNNNRDFGNHRSSSYEYHSNNGLQQPLGYHGNNLNSNFYETRQEFHNNGHGGYPVSHHGDRYDLGDFIEDGIELGAQSLGRKVNSVEQFGHQVAYPAAAVASHVRQDANHIANDLSHPVQSFARGADHLAYEAGRGAGHVHQEFDRFGNAINNIDNAYHSGRVCKACRGPIEVY